MKKLIQYINENIFDVDDKTLSSSLDNITFSSDKDKEYFYKNFNTDEVINTIYELLEKLNLLGEVTPQIASLNDKYHTCVFIDFRNDADKLIFGLSYTIDWQPTIGYTDYFLSPGQYVKLRDFCDNFNKEQKAKRFKH